MSMKKNTCEDCFNSFWSNEGRPWKYEKTIWLCDDCEAERMQEEDKS